MSKEMRSHFEGSYYLSDSYMSVRLPRFRIEEFQLPPLIAHCKERNYNHLCCTI